jgi:hypothetical protein
MEGNLVSGLPIRCVQDIDMLVKASADKVHKILDFRIESQQEMSTIPCRWQYEHTMFFSWYCMDFAAASQNHEKCSPCDRLNSCHFLPLLKSTVSLPYLVKMEAWFWFREIGFLHPRSWYCSECSWVHFFLYGGKSVAWRSLPFRWWWWYTY